MKIVLINDKTFDNMKIVRQTELVISILPEKFKGTEEEQEEQTIVIPWGSLLYMR